MTTLSDQVPEILDHICSFVDRPKDILSLALASKQFYDVAIPDHIEFRHLRCDIRRLSVWKKLAELPAISSQFVSLEVIVEDHTKHRRPLIPTHSKLFADRDQSGDILFDWDVSRWSSGSESSDDDDGDGVQDDEGWDTPESESEGSGGSEGKPEPEVTRETTLAMCLQALTAAVRCMPGLTCFHWLINSKYLQPTDDLFAALLECPVISDVEIFPGEDLSANDYGLWQFSNLRRFSMELTEEFNRDKVQRYTAHIIKMLDHCPNLHDLRLFPAYSTDLLYSVLGLDIAQIIEQGRWPSLKRLTLPMIGQFSPHSNDLLETFIGAHPNLEHLYFDDGIPPHSFVWTASLPNLKALHAGSNWDVGRIISPNIMRHLQFLSIVDLNSESRDENLRILAQIPTLRSLVVHLSFPSSELLDRLARAVPLIERLHFRSGTSPHFTETGIQTDQAEIFFSRLAFISCLPHLTHLSNLIRLNMSSKTFVPGPGIKSTVVPRVARSSTTLRHLRLCSSEYIPWITIERRAEGAYDGWHCWDSSEEVDHGKWGGFFLGAQPTPKMKLVA